MFLLVGIKAPVLCSGTDIIEEPDAVILHFWICVGALYNDCEII